NHCADHGVSVDGFIGDEPAEEDGNDGIDVGVGANGGCRDVSDEPRVGGVRDEGAEGDEIEEAEDRYRRNSANAKVCSFAADESGQQQCGTTDDHFYCG